jgi:hypothetical protein
MLGAAVAYERLAAHATARERQRDIDEAFPPHDPHRAHG